MKIGRKNKVNARSPIREVSFFKYEFYVSKKVFYPRPETEILVEVALDYIKEYISTGAKVIIVDVGVGTGCVIISIAKELQKYLKASEIQAYFIGIDIDKNAIEIAEKNAEFNSVEIYLVLADKLSAMREADFIISNPPYISFGLKGRLEATDPPHTIFGGPRGYEFTLDILKQSYYILKPGGFLFLEVGYDDLRYFNMDDLRRESKNAILSFAHKLGFYVYPPVKDFRRLERVIIMRKVHGR